jgi:carbamoyltransferase
MKIPRTGQKPLNLFFVSHHLCHAAHAFFESPFEEAAILTVDGYGERTSTLIAHGKGNQITPVLEIPYPHSIGSVYAAFTQYLGFRANSGEGKVMGLASYGSPKFADVIGRMIRKTESGFEVDSAWFEYMMDRRHRYSQRLVATLGPAREPESALTQHHMDVAASLQAVVEELLLHLAKLAHEKTGLRQLCMAGGVALNCVANGRIAQESEFDACFFQPSCHDAGTSAGAALYTHHMIHGKPRVVHAQTTDYLGPRFEPDVVRDVLEKSGVQFTEPSNTAEHAATRIASGRIIGRFAGRAEFGPRALGNRSILAAPGPADVKDTVNARVKFREAFRPFAPSVLEENCGQYFECATPSPFMLRVYQTRPEFRTSLGAVTHIDGGARVQTVTDAQNEGYAQLIHAVGERTGISCVLNTSFNIRGEPIVHSPQDALKCFFTTDMDDLYLGPFHVEKRSQSS